MGGVWSVGWGMVIGVGVVIKKGVVREGVVIKGLWSLSCHQYGGVVNVCG